MIYLKRLGLMLAMAGIFLSLSVGSVFCGAVPGDLSNT